MRDGGAGGSGMLYGLLLLLQSDRESVRVRVYCAQQVSGIVHDPSHANAMEVCWLMFLQCEKEQVDHCLVT